MLNDFVLSLETKKYTVYLKGHISLLLVPRTARPTILGTSMLSLRQKNVGIGKKEVACLATSMGMFISSMFSDILHVGRGQPCSDEVWSLLEGS